LCWMLLSGVVSAAPYEVIYYLPTGNDGQQKMVIEATSSSVAERIFHELMPKARISECRAVKK
jgi:hypothetical protein